MSTRALRAAGVAACLAAAASCREGPVAFTADDRPPVGTEDSWPITFSLSDDQAPVWSPAGDSVYYTTEGVIRTDPQSSWRQAAVAPEGGVAQPMRVGYAPVEGAALAVSPGRDRIAYVHPSIYAREAICEGSAITEGCSIFVLGQPIPRLLGFTVRVGPSTPGGATYATRVETDAILPPDGATRNWYIANYHPFQALHGEKKALLYRPSWSPDGTRIAFSDGRSIRVWTPGQGEPQIVPGTEDGVYPAWSPDGTRIAFTRLVRGARVSGMCAYETGRGRCFVERIAYDIVAMRLVLVNPDGTGAVELGEGLAPAWSPDGRAIFVHREGRIYRIAADGSSAEAVPETEGGYEPAVSPDGSRLAISRLKTEGDHDVWIVELR